MSELTKLTAVLQKYSNRELREIVITSAISWAGENGIAPYKIRVAIEGILRQYRTDLSNAAQVIALLSEAQTMRWQDIEGLDGLADELDFNAEQRASIIAYIVEGIMSDLQRRIVELQNLESPDISVLIQELSGGDNESDAEMNPIENGGGD